MTEEPKCAKCGALIGAQQNVVFPKAGGVAHVDCPENNEALAIRCFFCRTPIRTKVSSRTVQGVPYHAGCWDRKVRARSR